MLVIEEVCPMHPLARNGSRYHWSQSQVRIYRPYPDRDRHSCIHHVEKQGEGVGFGVLRIIQNQGYYSKEYLFCPKYPETYQKPPDGVYQSLLDGELLGGGAEVYVEAGGLVHDEEGDYERRPNREVEIARGSLDI